MGLITRNNRPKERVTSQTRGIMNFLRPFTTRLSSKTETKLKVSATREKTPCTQPLDPQLSS